MLGFRHHVAARARTVAVATARNSRKCRAVTGKEASLSSSFPCVHSQQQYSKSRASFHRRLLRRLRQLWRIHDSEAKRPAKSRDGSLGWIMG